MNTTAALHLPLRRVIFGDIGRDESATVLAGRLDEDNLKTVLTEASPALISSARTEVGSAVSSILDMDAFDALTLGWRKYRVLAEAARRTSTTPGTRELVELARHKLVAGYKPHIDVYVDGAKWGQLDLELALSADVVGVLGVVTEGRLVALRSGHIDLAVKLRCEGFDLASGDRRVDIGAELSLGDGIDLVPGSDSPDTPFERR